MEVDKRKKTIEKKRATQLFEVNNWFYFTANMKFGALLCWQISFLFWRGYYSRKRPQAPSQITIAQLIVLLETHGSQAPFRSFDGNSSEIPRLAPSIQPPREPPDKGTRRHYSNYRIWLVVVIAAFAAIWYQATISLSYGTDSLANHDLKK